MTLILKFIGGIAKLGFYLPCLDIPEVAEVIVIHGWWGRVVASDNFWGRHVENEFVIAR